MTYEAKKIAAQDKANRTNKTTCIYETCQGYRVGFLTAKTVGSAQEVFEPIANYTVHHEVATLHEAGMDWSSALAFCNID